MEKKVTKPRAQGFSIALSADLTDREVTASSSMIFNIMKKKDRADVFHYAVPEKEGDIFMRRVRLVKCARTETNQPLDDIPDLIDTNFTDLPWAGYTSLKVGSRQFNSKNVMATVVEVVKEYDGILFHFGVYHEPHQEPLQVFDLIRAKSGESSHYLCIRNDLALEERAHFINWAKNAPLPADLIYDLGKFGYSLSGSNTFVNTDVTDGHSANGTIHCVPYGVIREIHIGGSHVTG